MNAITSIDVNVNRKNVCISAVVVEYWARYKFARSNVAKLTLTWCNVKHFACVMDRSTNDLFFDIF